MQPNLEISGRRITFPHTTEGQKRKGVVVLAFLQLRRHVNLLIRFRPADWRPHSKVVIKLDIKLALGWRHGPSL